MYQEQSYQPPKPVLTEIPDDIVTRIKARDRTLAEDLTLNELVKGDNELLGRMWKYGISYREAKFIQDVLIPEKTSKEFLTRKEWKSLRSIGKYIYYIAGLLNYFSESAADKEGIEAVRNLILREKVDMSEFSIGYLRTYNPYFLKLVIDFKPKIIKWMFDNPNIRYNIPLLTEMLGYVKGKISKEYVLEFLEEPLRNYGMEHPREGKSIIAVLESGIIDFTDLYNLILKYNKPQDIKWANKVIKSQV